MIMSAQMFLLGHFSFALHALLCASFRVRLATGAAGGAQRTRPDARLAEKTLSGVSRPDAEAVLCARGHHAHILLQYVSSY